ncbi:hypothetical protein P0F65_00260 [Sphingomonas sp. I4]
MDSGLYRDAVVAQLFRIDRGGMMRKTVVMLGLGIALTAWSPGHAAQASPSPVATPCQVPPGWDQVDAKVVVFGEMHGTREAPAFVGNLACALAARGERVLVAVEHDVINDDDFQRPGRCRRVPSWLR